MTYATAVVAVDVVAAESSALFADAASSPLVSTAVGWRGLRTASIASHHRLRSLSEEADSR